MKHFTFSLVALCLFGFGNILSAQTSVNASGGDATGSGSASYSVGQVVYNTISGTTMTFSQGVQQPYEISVLTGMERSDIKMEMTTYPNPAGDFVMLKVNGYDSATLNYNMYDLNGSLVQGDIVTSDITQISTGSLKTGIYIIRITENGKELKTFKIIKNQ